MTRLAGRRAALAACPAMLFAAALAPSRGMAQAARELRLNVGEGQLLRLGRESGTVLLSEPEVADVQTPGASQVFVFARRPGRTTLIVLDGAGEPIGNWRIVVGRSAEDIRALLRAELSNPTLDVVISGQGAVLRGTVRTPQEAERARAITERALGEGTAIINALTVTGGLQVDLRVRVAEVSRSVSREFGLNVAALGSSGNFAFGVLSGREAISTVTGAVSRAGTGAGALFGSFRSGRTSASTLLDALASENLATILAEPNLVAVSGQPANFLAGGEFPVPVAQGLDRISVDYRRFGVGLEFVPTVLSDDLISLRVRPEVSELTQAGSIEANGFRIPGLRVRRAETTVELGSGQAFAIAGLLQNDFTTGIDRFPLLGDVPVLGALFRSNRFRRNETELVIIVSPTIVRPAASAAALRTPDALIGPPGDVEQILLGRVAARPGNEALAQRLSRVRLRGDGGFLLE